MSPHRSLEWTIETPKPPIIKEEAKTDIRLKKKSKKKDQSEIIGKQKTLKPRSLKEKKSVWKTSITKKSIESNAIETL